MQLPRPVRLLRLVNAPPAYARPTSVAHTRPRDDPSPSRRAQRDLQRGVTHACCPSSRRLGTHWLLLCPSPGPASSAWKGRVVGACRLSQPCAPARSLRARMQVQQRSSLSPPRIPRAPRTHFTCGATRTCTSGIVHVLAWWRRSPQCSCPRQARMSVRGCAGWQSRKSRSTLTRCPHCSSDDDRAQAFLCEKLCALCLWLGLSCMRMQTSRCLAHRSCLQQQLVLQVSNGKHQRGAKRINGERVEHALPAGRPNVAWPLAAGALVGCSGCAKRLPGAAWGPQQRPMAACSDHTAPALAPMRAAMLPALAPTARGCGISAAGAGAGSNRRTRGAGSAKLHWKRISAGFRF